MFLVIEIKVMPNSGKQKVIMDKSGILKVYLKNPPEKGLANNELLRVMAKAIGVTQNDIEIITGATARKKKLRIKTNISYDQLLEDLGIEKTQESDIDSQKSLKF